jgi:hypothetical protein
VKKLLTDNELIRKLMNETVDEKSFKFGKDEIKQGSIL